MEDIPVAANWIAAALQSSGYLADFNPSSLWEIDRFFDENTRQGQAVPGGRLAESAGTRLFALGCYVGEVIRRNVGGEWVADEAAGEVNIALALTDGGMIWPVQRMIKRFNNGAEDGIVAYGSAFGLTVGQPTILG